MNREIIGKRLRETRESLELTRKEVTDLVSIGTTTLQQWETGAREASLEIIEELAKLYKTTPQYIIFGDDNYTPKIDPSESCEYIYIPFYDIQASAGLGLFTDGAVEPSKHLAFRHNWANARGLQADKLVALLTKGDSMQPTIKNGAVIIVDTTDNNPADGNLYVVRIADELYVKRIQKIPHGIRLISDNKAMYAPLDINYNDYTDDQLQICGRIIHTSHDL